MLKINNNDTDDIQPKEIQPKDTQLIQLLQDNYKKMIAKKLEKKVIQ
jgi:hypothetical protein